MYVTSIPDGAAVPASSVRTTLTVRPEFIFDARGQPVVRYAGLLDAAHRSGLQRIATHLIQQPTEANMRVAIVSATVTTSQGTFDGLGDADPTNVRAPLQTALIRMAETRAKTRALRDAVNAGALVISDETDAPASETWSGDEDAASTSESPAGETGTTSPAGSAPAKTVTRRRRTAEGTRIVSPRAESAEPAPALPQVSNQRMYAAWQRILGDWDYALPRWRDDWPASQIDLRMQYAAGWVRWAEQAQRARELGLDVPRPGPMGAPRERVDKARVALENAIKAAGKKRLGAARPPVEPKSS